MKIPRDPHDNLLGDPSENASHNLPRDLSKNLLITRVTTFLKVFSGNPSDPSEHLSRDPNENPLKNPIINLSENPSEQCAKTLNEIPSQNLTAKSFLKTCVKSVSNGHDNESFQGQR